MQLKERGIRSVERYSWHAVVTQVLQAYEDAVTAPADVRRRYGRGSRFWRKAVPSRIPLE